MLWTTPYGPVRSRSGKMSNCGGVVASGKHGDGGWMVRVVRTVRMGAIKVRFAEAGGR